MKVKEMFKTMKGQGGIVGLVVTIILIVAVAIPITNSVIATANLSGVSKTIIDLLPVFLALGGLVVVAGLSTGAGR